MLNRTEWFRFTDSLNNTVLPPDARGRLFILIRDAGSVVSTEYSYSAWTSPGVELNT